MFDYLKTIMTQLTPASVTLKDLQPHLGSVVKTYPNNVHLKPQDDRFSHIDIVKQYQSDEVGHVDLTLVEPITLASLQKEFGESNTIVPDDSGPRQAIFYIRQPTKDLDIALIATLNRKGTEATMITLRRDVHPSR